MRHTAINRGGGQASWAPGNLKPFVDRALEVFGPDPCMFRPNSRVCRWRPTTGDAVGGENGTEVLAVS
jgi:hypothetical protein